MGRLSNIRPRLGGVKARVGWHADVHGHSPTLEPWRKWYGTQRWKDLRWEVLVRDCFTCQCGCGHIEADTSQLVADHDKPHRGDPALFWDKDNLQTLWKPHHDSWKQSRERRGPQRAGGV